MHLTIYPLRPEYYCAIHLLSRISVQLLYSELTRPRMSSTANDFLSGTKENEDLNQYWYSNKTIAALVDEIQSSGAKKIAFLSTPSLYFSLTDSALKAASYVFDVSPSPLSYPAACSL